MFQRSTTPKFRKPLLLFIVSVSILFFIAYNGKVYAQSSEELRQIRVDELTDDQLRRFVIELNSLNVSDNEMELQALQRGMNPDEIIKLRARLSSIRKSFNKSNASFLAQKPRGISDTLLSLERKPLDAFRQAFNELQSKQFGSEVFMNPKSTFEPNLRLPTPLNYVLAADDEIIIDISGYSEANYRLKVSPEGSVRIPNVGPVVVSGLTIEQAKSVISSKLSSTIYSNIRSGQTKINIVLAAIRSINVTIIGEALFPGTYTLPSVATLYNALYACSGINKNGSYRNIQLIRNNKTIATVDIYDYLVNGTKKSDMRLMDDDVIKINTYDLRIELKGEVKKPGIYDVSKNETLSTIIQYAGGFTENAYRERIKLFRNTERDREILTVSSADYKDISLKPGDSYQIEKILNRFTNRISINGAVYRPGEYELRTGMKLTELLADADGIRDDAFLTRGVIHRLKEDLSPELISFDLEQIINRTKEDIILQKEDRVIIYSKFDLKEGYFVSIEGEVSAPGVFLYEAGLTIEDLILMAGGIKEAASLKRVEVSRRIKSQDSTDKDLVKTSIIFQKDIPVNFKDSLGQSVLILEPFDQVTIYRAPGYYEQKNVVVEGEVLFPGRYALQSKNDRISDLVIRSGGITKEAYLKGAVLSRKRTFTKSEQINAEQGLTNLLKQNSNAGASANFLQLTYEEYIRKSSDNVGINLDIIIDNPASQYDLLLNDGDTLRIPKELQTVRVNGEVLYPAMVRYNKNYKFKNYISGAGGFNERSSKKKSYVVNPNGSAQATNSFLFFKSYPKVYPGSEIFVPLKREKVRLTPFEAITIGTTLVTLLAILLNVTSR